MCEFEYNPYKKELKITLKDVQAFESSKYPPKPRRENTLERIKFLNSINKIMPNR